MVIAHDFAYVRPETLEEALAILAAADGARVLAGGTDVVPWLRDEAIAPTMLVDIKRIAGLHDVERGDHTVRIGALVTFSDLIASPDVADAVPVLREMAHEVASVGIRNRATLVGNVCSAVPSLDAGPVLLVFDAVVHVVSAGGVRDVALAEWFVGPRETRLRPGELVTAVTLHLPEGRFGAAFLKLARYEGEDLAQANLAVLVTIANEYRVAFGAVGPTPSRASQIERLLAGHPLDQATIDEAVAHVGGVISPISDVRAGRDYREHMCRVMLRRGLAAALARRNGTGAPYPTRFI